MRLDEERQWARKQTRLIQLIPTLPTVIFLLSQKAEKNKICKKDTTPQDDFDEVPSLDANASQKCHAEELAVSSTDTNNWFVSCPVCKTLSSQTDSEGLF